MTGLYAKVLSLDEVRNVAPAVFTTVPKETTTDKYLFIPTSRILSRLLDNGFNVVSAKQQGARSATQRGFSKHVLHLIHSSQSLDLKAGNEYPLLRIQNSHDAKSSFQLSTGIFRLVCSNGIVMPETEFNSARIIHSVNTDQETLEASFRVIQNHGKELETIEQMKSINLTRDEQLLLADSSKRLVFDEETISLNDRAKINLTEKILTPRRHEDRATDLWTTFNVIQENAIKGGVRVLKPSKNGRYKMKDGLNERVGYRRTKGINSIDADKKINIELMTLAQEMVRLKA